MRRFLVVGCGGSGGKTLAYLMDQLRSDLGQDGVSSLPPGLQFVLIDVPSGIESGPDGLGNVVQQGGRYVGMGPKGGNYRDLDAALTAKLRNAGGLGEIGTWAPPSPDKIVIPIDVGAGQYRAIGRTILLNRAEDVRRALQEAWGRLFGSETETAMLAAAHATGTEFDPNLPPIVFVVGSMAGGSGASMALDVCRLLTQVPGLNPKLMSVFMVSADVFDSLPPADRAGVRANALAMLGEIVASQTGAARAHDTALLTALGQEDGSGTDVPFARVFPVSRSMGTDHVIFGDGSMNAVYRGLARGLAGLMSSDVAIDRFVAFDLGNQGFFPPDPKYLGWGADPQTVPWGSYGFASLSMGRDRYEEYAAQRIARTALDRLLDGHLQQGSTASGTEQVQTLLDSQWTSTCTRLGLPLLAAGGPDNQLRTWMTSTAYPQPTVKAAVDQIVERELVPHLPGADGQQVDHWREAVRRAAQAHRQSINDAVARSVYSWAYDWHRDLTRRVEAEVGRAASRLGLPYAAALVDRLAGHLMDVVAPGCQLLSSATPRPDIAELSEEVRGALHGIRGAITGDELLRSKVADGVRRKLLTQSYMQAADLCAEGMRSFVTEVLRSLGSALHEAQRILENARRTQVAHDGLARLETTQYGAWPSDSDAQVPRRFDEANNEVLLTTSREFEAAYERDLRGSVASESSMGNVRHAVADLVISGVWPTVGGKQPPGGLIEQTVGWRSKVFLTDPASGDALMPSVARYDVHIRPAELLDRARMFVRRPEESFQKFCATSLREYLSGAGAAESERDQRHRDVLSKFREVLSLAVPLISVDEQSVQMLYGKSVEYRYKFSAVPFRNLAVAADLQAVITGNPSIDSSSLDAYQKALTDQGNPRRIDVIGSYPLYTPLVFDSILEPVSREWAGSAPQARLSYWQHRRARPLPGALAMSDDERRAMVAGWYIGQILGELRIPEPPYATPVQIWSSEDSRWVSFPNPLLTAPQRFRAKTDWLPAVLESHLLAVARVQQPPVMSSLTPYLLLRALYDDSDLGPASGILEISAVARLAHWLARGSTSGSPSRIAAIAEADTPGERLKAAQVWLTEPGGPGDLAVQHFLPPDDFGPGGGTFSTISTRAQAAATPYFRDLAEDVRWAAWRISDLLDQADGLGASRGGAPEDLCFDGKLPDIEEF